ncbi:MAG: hypothetical protein IKY94_13415 [Lachnospiraceae bacterium]|nr:hypothetical protein [Lachnospiraceae bacterium]
MLIESLVCVILIIPYLHNYEAKIHDRLLSARGFLPLYHILTVFAVNAHTCSE